MNRGLTLLVPRAMGRFALLALVLPCAAFVVIGSFAPGFQLDRYVHEPGAGFVPRAVSERGLDAPGIGELAVFYARFAAGTAGGNFGRSREAADRPLGRWLAQRTWTSARVVAVALAAALALLAAGTALGLRPTGKDTVARRVVRAVFAPLAIMAEGLPLPFVGMVAFVLVVRLVPRDGALESPAAMMLWGGLALALGDAVAAGALRSARGDARRVLRRPFLLAAHLRGERTADAALPVLLPLLGARLRATLLLFLGGLVVVEPALGINGLGETLRDVIVDRAGTDALMLAGVLHLFALPVAAIDLASTVAGGLRGGATP